MKKEGSIRTARIADNIITYIFLIIISLIFLFPCVWLIAASFSKSGDIHSFSGFFPKEFSAQTFVDLFTDDVNGLYPYGRWFLNTLYVATMTCIIGTLLTILTGYVMSRFRFQGRDTIRKTTLLLGMFPGFMGMTAVYIIMGQLNLLNSLESLIFYYSCTAPLGYLVQKGYFDSIPYTIHEAATIDGAGYFTRITRIVLPYMRSVISVVITMAIIENFKQFPLIWTMTGGGPSNSTTTLAILSYREAFVSQNLGSGAAVTTIWMLLMILVVAVFKKIVGRQQAE